MAQPASAACATHCNPAARRDPGTGSSERPRELRVSQFAKVLDVDLNDAAIRSMIS